MGPLGHILCDVFQIMILLQSIYYLGIQKKIKRKHSYNLIFRRLEK